MKNPNHYESLPQWFKTAWLIGLIAAAIVGIFWFSCHAWLAGIWMGG